MLHPWMAGLDNKGELDGDDDAVIDDDEADRESHKLQSPVILKESGNVTA